MTCRGGSCVLVLMFACLLALAGPAAAQPETASDTPAPEATPVQPIAQPAPTGAPQAAPEAAPQAAPEAAPAAETAAPAPVPAPAPAPAAEAPVAGDAAAAEAQDTVPDVDETIEGVAVQIRDVLGETFEKTSWWQWGALLAWIFAGLLVGKIVQSILRGVAKRLRDRGWIVRSTVFENAASPASLVLFTIGLQAGLLGSQIGVPSIHLGDELAVFATQIVTLLYLVALGWFLFNLVDLVDVAMRHLTSKTESKLDDMVAPLLRKSLRIFLIIVFTIVVLQEVFELNVTGFLAGLGIAGLAISLAAQDSVKNLFGSLTVFFDKPFAVGDFITFDGYTGTVEEIGFRSTRIRMVSGHLVTVPNMKFTDQNVENISARPSIRREMNVTITYDTPPEKIEQAVQIVREVLNDPEVVAVGRFNLEDNAPKVAFNELNADSLNIRAYYWYIIGGDPDRGFFTYLEHAQIVNMKLFRRFAEAGIDFAFPSQTLYLAGDPGRELAVTVRREE